MYDTISPSSGYDLLDTLAMLEDEPGEELASSAASAFSEPPPVVPEPAVGAGGYALYRPDAPAARPAGPAIVSAASLRASAVAVPAPAGMDGKKLDVHALDEKRGLHIRGATVHYAGRVQAYLKQVFVTPDQWKEFLGSLPLFRIAPGDDLKSDFIPAAMQDKVLRIAKMMYGQQIAFNNRVGLNFRRHVMKCLLNGVKYASADIRRRYEVEPGSPNRWRGATLDTKKYAEDKKKRGKFNVSGTASGVTDAGSLYRFIWVITGTDPSNFKMYSNQPKFDRFHHSSFAAGKAIAAGGEWRVLDGQVDVMNGCSGHYRPELHRLLAAVRWLNSRGALSAGTKIELFQGKTPVPVLAHILLNDPEFCAKKNLKQFPS